MFHFKICANQVIEYKNKQNRKEIQKEQKKKEKLSKKESKKMRPKKLIMGCLL